VPVALDQAGVAISVPVIIFNVNVRLPAATAFVMTDTADGVVVIGVTLITYFVASVIVAVPAMVVNGIDIEATPFVKEAEVLVIYSAGCSLRICCHRFPVGPSIYEYSHP
jgi:hypothetical protein